MNGLTIVFQFKKTMRRANSFGRWANTQILSLRNFPLTIPWFYLEWVCRWWKVNVDYLLQSIHKLETTHLIYVNPPGWSIHTEERFFCALLWAIGCWCQNYFHLHCTYMKYFSAFWFYILCFLSTFNKIETSFETNTGWPKSKFFISNYPGPETIHFSCYFGKAKMCLTGGSFFGVSWFF